MKKRLSFILALALAVSCVQTAQAGNPDRQGEAGAYELLLNPWARSTGLHSMVTAQVRGVEAMRINPAGLGRIDKFEGVLARSNYYSGTGININAFGIGARVSEKGVLGISLMSIDFGDIDVTTTDSPEGTGATFSPSFFNIGITYAHSFSERIHTAITGRIISESVSDAGAFGFALDAGVQYVTGPKDQIKFGIALRNVGTPMKYSGEGLSFVGRDPADEYSQTINMRSARFELPTTLNIGFSYDFLFGPMSRLTTLANFSAHSFSQDQLGAGLEYSFNNMFSARLGYRYEIGQFNDANPSPVYTGLAAGFSVDVPLGKKTVEAQEKDGESTTSITRLGLDYSYRTTNPFGGSHNFGVRLTF